MPQLELLPDQIHQVAHNFLIRDPKNREALDKHDMPYISEEGLTLLIANLINTKKSDTDYDIRNTFITWDQKKQPGQPRPYEFVNLSSFLQSFGPLPEGSDMKLIIGMTFPSVGHTVTMYLRNVNHTLKVFLYDVNRGLTLKDSSSHEIIIAVRGYAKSHGLDYKIVVNSTTLQKDYYTCPAFSYASTRYFMKHGHELFQAIDNPKLQFGYDGQFDGQPDPKIVFLKADALPARLLKWGQFKTFEEFEEFHRKKVKTMREVYKVEAEDIVMRPGVQFDSKDLFAQSSADKRADEIVNTTKNLTLSEYRLKHLNDLEKTDGKVIRDALTPTLEKNSALLEAIVELLNQQGCINEDLTLNEVKVSELLNKSRAVITRDHSQLPRPRG